VAVAAELLDQRHSVRPEVDEIDTRSPRMAEKDKIKMGR
jgi:hypothetical protein